MAKKSAMTGSKTSGSPGKKNKDGSFSITAKLGGLSVNKTVASFAVSGEFGVLTPRDVHKNFCNARLAINIEISDEQGTLPGMAPDPIDTVADCKRVSMGEGDFSGRLCMSLGDSDIKQLAQYHNKTVKLTAKRIGSAVESDGGDGGSDDDPEASE